MLTAEDNAHEEGGYIFILDWHILHLAFLTTQSKITRRKIMLPRKVQYQY